VLVSLKLQLQIVVSHRVGAGNETFFFSDLGTKPRALRLLGKRSTTELNPQPLEMKLSPLEERSFCGIISPALCWKTEDQVDHVSSIY